MATTGIKATASTSGALNYHIQQTALARGLGRLNSDLVAGKLVTNYTQDAVDQGSKFAQAVRVPKRGTVAATDKTPGSDVTPSAATSTAADITVNKHKTWDILVEDYGSLFAQEGVLAGYLMDGGAAIAEAVEADILALYSGASKVLGSTEGGASAALIRTIRKNSREDKWRQSQPNHIIWGPEGEEDLLGQDLFVKANESGSDEALVNATLGRKFGFNHYTSNLAPTIAGSPAAEHALAFQPEGIGIAFVPLGEANLPAEFQGNAGVIMRSMVMNDDDGVPAYFMRFIVGYDQKARGYMLTVDSIYGVNVVRSELVYDVLV